MRALVTLVLMALLTYAICFRHTSWGRMITEASGGRLYTSLWMLVLPGLALVLTTLAFNLVGDGFRDALDSRTRNSLAVDKSSKDE
jgi:ABC-type dipeptide/oligopeptide/nickel transport system permease subunit